MNVDDALEIVESQVLSRQLTPIERLIFCQSWEGKGYVEIADGSGYNSNYFKELGSKLWHNLSEVLQQKVTKIRYLQSFLDAKFGVFKDKTF